MIFELHLATQKLEDICDEELDQQNELFFDCNDHVGFKSFTQELDDVNLELQKEYKEQLTPPICPFCNLEIEQRGEL